MSRTLARLVLTAILATAGITTTAAVTASPAAAFDTGWG